MARVSALVMAGGLAAGAVAVVLVIAAVKEPEPGSLAAFRAMSAASGIRPAYSVPVEDRRRNTDTCLGYILELEEAAGIQRRIGDGAEAERLLGLRQSCHGAASTTRSAK